MKEQIEQVRAAVIKANSDKDWYEYRYGKQRPIPCRLNDVMLAAGTDRIGTSEQQHADLISILVLWDYWNDDLSAQSEGCVAFLYDLLK
jgi:hypothetical protein